MKLNQRGATLLEAILATAIMGMFMVYLGTQAVKFAEQKALQERAFEIARNIKTYRDFMVSPSFETSRAVDGRDYVMNSFWTMSFSGVRPLTEANRPRWGSFNRYYVLKTLRDLKLNTCTADGGILNQFVIEKYVECGKFDVTSPLRAEGFYVFVKPQTSIHFPTMESRPFAIQFYYILENALMWDDMVATATAITDIEFEDGFYIDGSDIFLAVLTPSGSAYLPDYRKLFSLQNLMDGDIAGYNGYKELVATTAGAGLMIELEFNENADLIRRDGSVAMEESASLCWSDGVNENTPCIGAFIDDAEPENNAILVQNNLQIDGSLLFKDPDGNYRTPVTTKYHTFVAGVNTISYVDCPNDPDEPATPLIQKIALVPSSFSTGTENSSNFTNPSSIISQGTKGADGKHAFTSGLSLEWTADEDNARWIVEGAIGFDARYQSSNGNQSVARNPKSISFISMQWCEKG